MSRRHFLLTPLLLYAGSLMAAENTTPVPVLPSDACPLNSGGPSLLGTRWRLFSMYDNKIPDDLAITMEVGENDMSGIGGCNNYQAIFERIGNRGFKVLKIDQSRKPCEVLRPGPGEPTINVGTWEGSYLRILRRAGSVNQQGLALQFYDFNGKPSIVFVKQLSQSA